MTRPLHNPPARRLGCWLAVFALWCGATPAAQALTKNGFELDGALVPADEILRGGPPRDGIPAIDDPKFIEPEEARRLRPGDRVLGLSRNGVAKAYPIAILNWHEIVNDRLGDEPVVVTFCPLCGTGVAFSAAAAGRARTFGVSGLLYNSDVLLYDRRSGSLWSQLLGKAITGPLKGTVLEPLSLRHTTWAGWRDHHPDTLVLSRDTGYDRDYDRDPYAGYVDNDGTIFPVRHVDPRYHPKERVLGVEIDGVAKAYPFSELDRGPAEFTDRVGGRTLTIRYDGPNQSAAAHGRDGEALAGTIAFWFAWYAFHPDTAVYTTDPGAGPAGEGRP